MLYRLHHGDLNLANILVSPGSFEITGIMDWEMINIVPLWKASYYPVFLQDIEPLDEEEPPIPSYEDVRGSGRVYAGSVGSQDPSTPLRHHYGAIASCGGDFEQSRHCEEEAGASV